MRSRALRRHGRRSTGARVDDRAAPAPGTARAHLPPALPTSRSDGCRRLVPVLGRRDSDRGRSPRRRRARGGRDRRVYPLRLTQRHERASPYGCRHDASTTTPCRSSVSKKVRSRGRCPPPRPVIEEVERRPDVIVLVHCIPLLDGSNVTGGMVLLRDVTDLRRLDRLLLTKDAAIREVHHRVKNNLQTISSLLRLQARRLEPGEAQQALKEAERRVRSIAVVHEILSRDPGEEVPFADIVVALVRMAEDSVVGPEEIEIRVTGDLGEVGAGLATPLAVVIAELIQNALEHGFRSSDADGEAADGPARVLDTPGHIDLLLEEDGSSLRIQVRDDGVGLPPGFDVAATKTLGLSIVRDLVESQLGGTILMSSRGGTVVDITVLRDPAAADHAW